MQSSSVAARVLGTLPNQKDSKRLRALLANTTGLEVR
jgi:hypothetical protein